MKFTFLLASLLMLSISPIKMDPGDFDTELSYIARKFKAEIMDEDVCEKQLRAVSDLLDEIEDAIEEEDEYSAAEILEFKKLKKEAAALEDFMGIVSGLGMYTSSIEDFHLGNRRVGASVARVVSGKYCVDVISVTIGEHVALSFAK